MERGILSALQGAGASQTRKEICVRKVGVLEPVERVADHESLIGREVVIHSSSYIVPSSVCLAGEIKQTADVIHFGPIRSRIQRQDLLNKRIQGQTKNIVGRAGGGDIYQFPIEGEFASLEVLSWHCAGVRQSGDEALSLVVRKPESFVWLDWSPNRASEGIADVRILRLHLPYRIEL